MTTDAGESTLEPRALVCRTSGCTEAGISKPVEIMLFPGEVVHCGECTQPCEVTPPIPTTRPHPREDSTDE